VDRLAGGGLVAFPTETVWGLAADARSPAAVRALQAWKGRGESQPMSVLVTGASAVEQLGYALGASGRRLADRFWPGPLTLVVAATERAAALAPGVAREDGAVGFRCSSHPAARALAWAAEQRGVGPLTATSLNRSGEPPARDREAARAICSGPDAPYLWPERGIDAGGARPSSVVDVTGDRPRVLREGAVSARELVAVGGATNFEKPVRSGAKPPPAGDQPEEQRQR